MIRYTFKDADAYMVGMGLFHEVGADYQAVGGNEILTTTDPGFDSEQQSELDKLLFKAPNVEGPYPIQTDPPPVALPDATAPPPEAGGILAGQEALTAEEVEPPVDPDMPPRSGAGSGRDAWVAYAGRLRAAGVAIPEFGDDTSRDQIIELVEAHR